MTFCTQFDIASEPRFFRVKFTSSGKFHPELFTEQDAGRYVELMREADVGCMAVETADRPPLVDQPKVAEPPSYRVQFASSGRFHPSLFAKVDADRYVTLMREADVTCRVIPNAAAA